MADNNLTRHVRNFAACLEAVERDRRAGRQEDAAEGETRLTRLASALLLAHGEHQARLPNSVAAWLHMKSEGRSAPAFQDVPVGADKIDLTELSDRFEDSRLFVEEARRVKDQVALVKKGEAIMARLASMMLAVHSRHQADLPRGVALHLHMRLDGELLADEARAQHRNSTSGNQGGPDEITAKSFIAGYIDRGPGGSSDKDRRRRRLDVARRVGVTERGTREWKERDVDPLDYEDYRAKLKPGADVEESIEAQLDYLAGMIRHGHKRSE